MNYRLTGSDPHLTSSTQASHTFNEDNWFEPYRITVDAAQDSDTIDGMRTIQHPVVTDNPFYKKRSPRFVLVSERDNDPDQNGRKTHSEDLGVSPAVTATLEYAPRGHNSDKFSMCVRFSEPVRTGYKDLRDYAFETGNARVMGADRIHGKSDLWRFIIKPCCNDNISLPLRGDRPCSEEGTVCSTAGSKRLGNTLTVALAGNDGEDAELPPGTAGEGVLTREGVSVTEGLDAVFFAKLTEPMSHDVTVEFAGYGITATDREDFDPVHPIVTIAPDPTVITIPVTTLDDEETEDRIEIGGILFNPDGARIKTAQASVPSETTTRRPKDWTNTSHNSAGNSSESGLELILTKAQTEGAPRAPENTSADQ